MSLTRSEAVSELGKRLVLQLGTDSDLLGSWMAHNVAAHIEAVEKASPKGKLAAQTACAQVILELWRHRNVLPRHLDPLAELDPVIRTLASLDVDVTDHRYSPEALRTAATATAEGDAKRGLEFAIGLDYAARLIIQSALRSVARNAALIAEPWVELARQAGAEATADRFVVNFILDLDDDGKRRAALEEKALRDRLDRVEAFASLAASLADKLKAQLSLKAPM